MSKDVIESALDATGLGWKRRGGGWVIPAGGRLPREVQVTPEGDGVRVEAVLVEWDEIGTDERAALSQLFRQAQPGLRFARCELSDTRARLTALVEARHVEGALADSVGGVVAGCRLLAREVGALLSLTAARVFLDFFEGTGEKAADVRPYAE